MKDKSNQIRLQSTPVYHRSQSLAPCYSSATSTTYPIKSSVRLLADYCVLYRTIRRVQEHGILQQDLNELETWANTRGMRFNVKKYYILTINQKTSTFYQLENHILQQVPENPYLGVILSNDLTRSSHINKITKQQILHLASLDVI